MKKEKKDEIKMDKEINVIDIAIGGSVAAVGLAFLALVFVKGSNDPLISGIRKNSTDMVKKMFT